MILVTGATGHVGRAVVSRLASLGHDVGRNGPGRPSRKQAPAIWNSPARCGLRGCLSFEEGARGPLRAENQRAFEISFFEQRPVVRQIAWPARRSVSGTAPE